MQTHPAAPISQIATAKLHPRLSSPRPVPRTRVVDFMHAAKDAALVLVHGPAGFGKTTAMLQYYAQLHHRATATGWLTLDRVDNDVDRFVRYLIEAFGAIDPGVARALDGRGAPASGEGTMADLAEHLSSFKGAFALFLDDFELIESPVVLGLVRQLVEVLPEGGQLVIGSRTVPNLGLGRLRAHGRLVEIKTAQLRFSPVETAGFFRHQRGLALRDEDIRRLHQRTEGWPAALWLVSLALQGRDDPHAFVETFDSADAGIADYLVEDVLARQNQTLRDFLLRTSVLQELSAPLCDTLLGRTDSAELLAQVERAHLFLVPQDQDCHWYRYHPLFAGVLRDQLRQEAPRELPRLYRRVAQWWLAQNQPMRAIEYALHAGDPGYLAELLEAHAGNVLWQGRARTLARWYMAIPWRAQLTRHPAIALVFAWALTLTHRYDESQRLIGALESHYAAGAANGAGAQPPLPEIAIRVQRAFIFAMSDRVRESSALWRRCEPDVTPAMPFSYAMLGASFGFCLVAESRFEEARHFLARARRRVMEIGNSFIAPMALCIEGAIDFAQGQRQHAVARFRAALEGSGAVLAPHASGGTVAAAFLAEALYEGNDLDEAQRLLNLYLPMLRDVAAPDQLITPYVVLARIAFARGELERAGEWLTEMEVTGHQHALARMVATACLERARMALLRGQIQTAQDQLDAGSDARTWEPLKGLVTQANDTEAPFIGALRLRIRTGHAESAIAPLRQAIKEAERLQRQRRTLKLNILLAEAQCLSGQEAAGLRRLRDALRFAQAEGFVRSFVDEGAGLLRWIAKLRVSLENAPGEEALALFADRLLMAGGLAQSTAEHALEPFLKPAAVAAAGLLSRRELQVLRLLADGLRNRAIAERLFVSETTVKAHLRSINVKLGAHTRTHALALARQMNLLA